MIESKINYSELTPFRVSGIEVKVWEQGKTSRLFEYFDNEGRAVNFSYYKGRFTTIGGVIESVTNINQAKAFIKEQIKEAFDDEKEALKTLRTRTERSETTHVNHYVNLIVRDEGQAERFLSSFNEYLKKVKSLIHPTLCPFDDDVKGIGDTYFIQRYEMNKVDFIALFNKTLKEFKTSLTVNSNKGQVLPDEVVRECKKFGYDVPKYKAVEYLIKNPDLEDFEREKFLFYVFGVRLTESQKVKITSAFHLVQSQPEEKAISGHFNDSFYKNIITNGIYYPKGFHASKGFKKAVYDIINNKADEQ